MDERSDHHWGLTMRDSTLEIAGVSRLDGARTRSGANTPQARGVQRSGNQPTTNTHLGTQRMKKVTELPKMKKTSNFGDTNVAATLRVRVYVVPTNLHVTGSTIRTRRGNSSSRTRRTEKEEDNHRRVIRPREVGGGR